MKTARWPVFVLLLLLGTAAAMAGSIYKWVDEKGVVHYSDGAPAGGKASGAVESLPAVAGESSPPTAPQTDQGASAGAEPAGVDAPRKTPVVEIYTTSWCHYCKDAKRYFRSRGIAFTEYDVEKDQAAAQRLRRYNPRGGVPLTVINGQPIVGYAPAAFARALEAT
jgi:glutaredoxin-like YruB-family protein